MLKKSALLFLSMFIISCSEKSISEEKISKSFNVSLDKAYDQVSVDELITLNIESEEPLSQISWIRDKVTTTLYIDDSQVKKNFTLYFQFPTIGEQNVKLKFISNSEKTVEKDLKFNVVRGNTVQITGVTINSFDNINESWDPEFANESNERFADIGIALTKTFMTGFNKKEYSGRLWYVSDIHENQKDLNWNWEDENLFVNVNSYIEFGISDDDGGNIGQNLLGDYISLPINLREYQDTRPSSISIIKNDIDLDVTFYLDWPED